MLKLNTMNKFFTQSSAIIQKTIEDNRACTTPEMERAFLVAGGQDRITLDTLATSNAGKLIARFTFSEDTLYIYPEGAKNGYQQNKDASIYTVVAHNILMSGYTSQGAIKTALENWLDIDNPDIKIDNLEELSKALLLDFIKYDIIEDKEENGRMSDGAYFNAYPVTDVIQCARIEAFRKLLETAKPKMQPMKFPLTWNLQGTCELKNLRLKVKNPTQAYIDALNKAGHTPYKLNNNVLGLIMERFENGYYEDLDTPEENLTGTIRALLSLEAEQVYFFPITDDYRGRLYMRGGLTTPQGIKDLRACWDFANYKNVDEYGLFLHIANATGNDKLSITNRLKWVKDNHIALMTTPYGNLYAERARIAYIEYKETGKTNIVCRIDGTVSGVQITSGLYLDKKTGAMVNVGASTIDDEPQDLYGVIAKTSRGLAKGKEAELFDQFGRDLTKKVIMILAYGAGQDTRIQTINEFLQKENVKGNAKRIEKLIMTAIKIDAKSITKLNNNLQLILENKPTHKLTYSLSDCSIKFNFTNKEHLTIRGTAYSTILKGDAVADPRKLASGIAPNFVHSLDSELLRKAINVIDSDCSPIHDDIGVHSCDIEKALQAVRTSYIEVIEAEPLAELYRALGATYRPQNHGLNLNDVLESTYIFS
jgi:hypothetical protein